MEEFNFFCSTNEDEMQCVRQQLKLANFDNPVVIKMSQYLASDETERARLDEILEANDFKYYYERPILD